MNGKQKTIWITCFILTFTIGYSLGFYQTFPNPLLINFGYDESFERTIDKMDNLSINISNENCPDCICDNKCPDCVCYESDMLYKQYDFDNCMLEENETEWWCNHSKRFQ